MKHLLEGTRRETSYRGCTALLHSLKKYENGCFAPVASGERGIVAGQADDDADKQVEVAFDGGGRWDVLLSSISRADPTV